MGLEGFLFILPLASVQVVHPKSDLWSLKLLNPEKKVKVKSAILLSMDFRVPTVRAGEGMKGEGEEDGRVNH